MSIKTLAAKVATLPRDRDGRRQYDDTIKREVMAAWRRSGLSKAKFAALVGVPSVNLTNWRRFATVKRAPIKPRPKFKALVVAPAAETSTPRPSTGLRVVGPGGLVVECGSAALVAEVLAAVAARSPC